jgi:hypothetical protein
VISIFSLSLDKERVRERLRGATSPSPSSTEPACPVGREGRNSEKTIIT